MGIGDNTRQIILRRLSQSQSLQEIDYCLELWVQTHGFRQAYFIGLTSQIAFDRNAYFIHAHDEEAIRAIEEQLKSGGVMALRQNVISRQAFKSQKLFPDIDMHCFCTYGPRQSVGVFLLKQHQYQDITQEERLFIAQELHPFKTALFKAYAQKFTSDIKLTQREAEVLSWVAQGKSNTVIADIMNVSPHTIDNYLRRTYAKIGVNSRTSAAIKALLLGLTSI
jgi:DNA-binding CsgD family transcriptional regulator